MSLKNAVISFLIVGMLVGLFVGLLWLTEGLTKMLQLGLFYGLFFGLIGGLNRGGSAVLKHYALRLIFWLNGSTPIRFIQLLDHCAKLILLKKVGGGYMFIHRTLLEYFAELNTQTTKQPQSSRTQVRHDMVQFRRD